MSARRLRCLNIICLIHRYTFWPKNQPIDLDSFPAHPKDWA